MTSASKLLRPIYMYTVLLQLLPLPSTQSINSPGQGAVVLAVKPLLHIPHAPAPGRLASLQIAHCAPSSSSFYSTAQYSTVSASYS